MEEDISLSPPVNLFYKDQLIYAYAGAFEREI
jgi:hypothetical protein